MLRDHAFNAHNLRKKIDDINYSILHILYS